MNSIFSTNRIKKIRILTSTGTGFLLGGIALYWAATPLARVYLTRDTHGSVSQIDEDLQDRMEFTGDKLSWVGVGLVLISSAAWIGPRKDESAPK